MVPSSGFVSSLHAYDPLLNVRWGDYVNRWVVERKAYITETEIWFLTRRTDRLRLWKDDPTRSAERRRQLSVQYDEIREELRSAQSGQRVVFMPKELNSLAFNVLAMMDIQRWGGYSRMADELEKQESREDAEQERKLAGQRYELHRHTYDILDFLWRKRSTELSNGVHLTKSLKEILQTSEL